MIMVEVSGVVSLQQNKCDGTGGHTASGVAAKILAVFSFTTWMMVTQVFVFIMHIYVACTPLCV